MELRNVRLVEGELARRGLVTSTYVSKTDKITGGKPFSRGHIYRVLSNPLYIGEIEHKGDRHPGLHPPIVDRETWDAVQALLASNGHENRTRSNANQAALLPLGARALYLYRDAKDTMFRIHGPTEPWSIGQAVSNGCIRMVNEHVSEFYDRVPIGTRVVVL